MAPNEFAMGSGLAGKGEHRIKGNVGGDPTRRLRPTGAHDPGKAPPSLGEGRSEWNPFVFYDGTTLLELAVSNGLAIRASLNGKGWLSAHPNRRLPQECNASPNIEDY